MKPLSPVTLKPLAWIASTALGVFLTTNSFAQETESDVAEEPPAEEAAVEEAGNGGEEPARPHLPPPSSAETEGKVTIGDKEIPYTATAGTVTLKNSNGRPSAQVFYVSYVRSDIDDVSTRPVTFCFNGGPGSSAVWLHLGGIGPKKVVLPDDGIATPKPPARLATNPYSILDETDLVFVDPVSTGFSRSQKPDGAGNFHGINEDVDSMGDFIRRWIIENRRWSSPKFLLGESYGGLRVAGLSAHLQDRYGIYLNGTILLSAVLDFSTLRSHSGSDLAYICFFPTLAMTAQYHKVLGEEEVDLDALKLQLERFVRDEYAPALFKGSDLTDEEKKALAAKMSNFIGLSPELIFRSNLRISSQVFFKELLRERGKVTGRFDSRVLGDDPDDAGAYPSYDPSYSNIYGAFASAMKGYVREELNFDSDLVYEILTSKVRPWDYSSFEGRYVNVAPNLARAMQKNPHLKVLALCGYYDMATPYYGMEHTFRHMPLDKDLRGNLSLEYYNSGHMMYNNLPDLIKLRKDLVKFYQDAK